MCGSLEGDQLEQGLLPTPTDRKCATAILEWPSETHAGWQRGALFPHGLAGQQRDWWHRGVWGRASPGRQGRRVRWLVSSQQDCFGVTGWSLSQSQELCPGSEGLLGTSVRAVGWADGSQSPDNVQWHCSE